MMPKSNDAFAQMHELGMQFVSISGQLQMTMLVAAAHLGSELFFGQQSSQARHAIQEIAESSYGGHKVITAAFGRG